MVTIRGRDVHYVAWPDYQPLTSHRYWEARLSRQIYPDGPAPSKDCLDAIAAMASDFSRFDEATGKLADLERTYHLMEAVAPHGLQQSNRKQWSYCGGVRQSIESDDVRDPGNYCYGVIMRHCASSQAADDWKTHAYMHDYNDETLGDILEAILGAAWSIRTGKCHAAPHDIAVYERYAELIESAVIACEIVIQHTGNIGIRTDSKTLRLFLL